MMKKQSCSLPEQHKNPANTGHSWFQQKSYFFVPLAILVIYSLIASVSPPLLSLLDIAITPLVDSLHFIGLDIAKPFIDGPMPERYYTNLAGIGVWGLVMYNSRTFWWMADYCRRMNFVEVAAKQAQENKGWSAARTWIVQRVFLVLFIFPLAIYALFCILNSTQGWVVFHVKDMFTPFLLVVTFQAPGMFFVGLLSMLGIYLFHDLKRLLKTITRYRALRP